MRHKEKEREKKKKKGQRQRDKEKEFWTCVRHRQPKQLYINQKKTVKMKYIWPDPSAKVERWEIDCP